MRDPTRNDWQRQLSSPADVERAGRLGRDIVISHGTEFARQLGMFWLALDTDDVDSARWARECGYWEASITCWMAREISRPGMFCVDVGANHGYYTFLLAALGARVLALEPQARLFDLLSNASEMNGSADVRLLNAAAGRRAGEMPMYVPLRHGMNATISSTWRPPAPFGAEEHTVMVVPLDDVVGSDRVEFVKIDAEGAEPDVWEGMTRAWAQFRPTTLLEFHWNRYVDPAAFGRRLFAEAAVSFVDLDGTEVRLRAWDELATKQHEDWMLVLR